MRGETNIPDLTNASPGDVYEGPDGRLWMIEQVGANRVDCRTVAGEKWLTFQFDDESDRSFLSRFKKVDG